ncbi:hypothetical protein [Pararhodospirillum oryzae]|nr:hypothetical protein [Pararhodospirillum oryzae]
MSTHMEGETNPAKPVNPGTQKTHVQTDPDLDRLRQILDGLGHGGTLPPEAGRIRRTLAERFGRRWGLTLTPPLREFGPRSLAEMAGPRRWRRDIPDWPYTVADHHQCFADATGRAAMVACHNYSWHPHAIREFARRHGLVALIDPADPEGWWWPGGPTYLVIYRPTTARPLDGLGLVA